MAEHIQPRIERGYAHKRTLVSVASRLWSEPIPDEFLPRFEAAGLVVDDEDHAITAYSAGRKVGAVWGPAIGGGWFAFYGQTDPIRVDDRDAGLRHLLEAASRG